jgi:hypothetical protein
MVKRFIACFGACLAVCLPARPAVALTPFNKPFEEKYVKNHPDAAFREAFKKTRCNVCHVKGKPKTVTNAYGDELAKHIEGNAEERIRAAKLENREAEEVQTLVKELEAAFAKVEKVKSAAGDDGSPTYGELIQSGRLPAGGE